ncbi:MAG: hypothetical protein AB1742_06745 [bacterium]
MDVSAVQNAVTTAALARTLSLQYAQLALLLKSLQEMEQAQIQVLQSLGVALNVDLLA